MHIPTRNSVFGSARALHVQQHKRMCAEGRTQVLRDESTLPSRQVLVADDNPVNQMVASLTLQKLGYTATVVANGRQAVKAWRAGTFCAILMDCQMPEMDGFQATREIRSRETGARVPILAMTASDIPDDRRKCREAGMDGYLTKPLNAEKLVTVLAGVSVHESESDAPAPEDDETPLDRPTIVALRQLAVDGEPDPLPEIADRFLRNASARLARLNGDSENVVLIANAHSLRGMSGTIGAHRLARLCAQLETQASDGPTSDRLIDEIWFEFQRVRRTLESELHRPIALSS